MLLVAPADVAGLQRLPEQDGRAVAAIELGGTQRRELALDLQFSHKALLVV
ncbi:hypothetical protein GCM10022222_16680 [Amycolatopsis ultiminotia]|uniref:Uncharacterized protein n=1 Tax=Amycolatopsis ultiminotia TaxID=543629 RepID=A0ABP6VIW8_9PSEU